MSNLKAARNGVCRRTTEKCEIVLVQSVISHHAHVQLIKSIHLFVSSQPGVINQGGGRGTDQFY